MTVPFHSKESFELGNGKHSDLNMVGKNHKVQDTEASSRQLGEKMLKIFSQSTENIHKDTTISNMESAF